MASVCAFAIYLNGASNSPFAVSIIKIYSLFWRTYTIRVKANNRSAWKSVFKLIVCVRCCVLFDKIRFSYTAISTLSLFYFCFLCLWLRCFLWDNCTISMTADGKQNFASCSWFGTRDKLAYTIDVVRDVWFFFLLCNCIYIIISLICDEKVMRR